MITWLDFLDEFDRRAEGATDARPPHYGNAIDIKQTWGKPCNPTQYMRIVTENDRYWYFNFKFFGKLEGTENNFYVRKSDGALFDNATPTPGREQAKSAVVFMGKLTGVSRTHHAHGQPYINIYSCANKSIDIYSKKEEKEKNFMEDINLKRYKSMEVCKTHPYLAKKKIPAAPGLKIDKNMLLVPYVSLDNLDEVRTIQRIYEENGDYVKKVCKDHKILNVCYIFDGLDEIIYLCEGFATASTVNMLTNRKTIAFIGTAGLKRGTESLRFCNCSSELIKSIDEHGLNTQHFIVIADNDYLKHKGEINPGLDTAKQILHKTGIPYICPDFSSLALPEYFQGTDFNDLVNTFGRGIALEQIHSQSPEMRYPGNLFKKCEKLYQETCGMHSHVDYYQCRSGVIYMRYKSSGVTTQCQLSRCSPTYKNFIETSISTKDRFFDFTKYAPGKSQLFVDSEGNTILNIYSAKEHVEADINISAPFFELVDYICKGDVKEYFLDFLATLVQQPHVLMPIVPIIISSEKGRGKGLIIEVIVRLLGRHNCAPLVSKKLFDINNNFNSYLAEKQLIYVEEVEFNRTQYTEFKNLITEKLVSCNKKFMVEHVTERTCNFICSCNDIARLSFDADERRFLFIEITGEAKPQEFYDNIGFLKENSPEFLGAIYKFLMQRKIKNSMTHIHPAVLQATTMALARDSSSSAKMSKAAQLLLRTNKLFWTLSEFQEVCERADVGLSKTQATNCLRNNGYAQHSKYENKKYIRGWLRRDNA
jgi:phage/plasmid primase-like uncharacterized protein